jgi:hypothetical protein
MEIKRKSLLFRFISLYGARKIYQLDTCSLVRAFFRSIAIHFIVIFGICSVLLNVYIIFDVSSLAYLKHFYVFASGEELKQYGFIHKFGSGSIILSVMEMTGYAILMISQIILFAAIVTICLYVIIEKFQSFRISARSNREHKSSPLIRTSLSNFFKKICQKIDIKD